MPPDSEELGGRRRGRRGSEAAERPRGEAAHPVADVVAGRVDLEQLRAALLVDADQDGHHAQRPHVRVLRGARGPVSRAPRGGAAVSLTQRSTCAGARRARAAPACTPAPGPPGARPGSPRAPRSRTCAGTRWPRCAPSARSSASPLRAAHPRRRRALGRRGGPPGGARRAPSMPVASMPTNFVICAAAGASSAVAAGPPLPRKLETNVWRN